jgi:hypothetical protein
MRLGLELTFIPDRPSGPKEFSCKKEAQRAADALFRALRPLRKRIQAFDIDLGVKVDVFRLEPDPAWIIEVVNCDKPTWDYQWEDPMFVALIQQVFDRAKKLKLLPRIRRNGIHHPSGGGHAHIGIADLFPDDHLYLARLYLFERNLYTDFANRPYIRWLFAEWFDSGTNSQVTFGAMDLKTHSRAKLKKKAYEWGRTSCSIAARYSYRYKPAYPTYEYRFFDMGDSAKDIARNVRFLVAWVNHHVAKATNAETVPFTLTLPQFESFRNLRTAWREISRLLRELGLDPKDYRGAFEDNYVPRMRYGEMT